MKNVIQWLKDWWQALVGAARYDHPPVPHEEMTCVRCGGVFCFDCGTAFSHISECFLRCMRPTEPKDG